MSGASAFAQGFNSFTDTADAFSIALVDNPPGSAHFVGDKSLSVSGASACTCFATDLFSRIFEPGRGCGQPEILEDVLGGELLASLRASPGCTARSQPSREHLASGPYDP